MNRFPPIRRRDLFEALAMAFAIALTAAACETTGDEDLAGLVVVSHGPVRLTDAAGEPAAIRDLPGDLRRVTAADGRLVAQTIDGRLLVADPPRPDGARAWRVVALPASSSGAVTGMDLSPDGARLAIVRGDPDTRLLDLVTIDLESGEASDRSVEVMANGPPAWLGPDLVALEVIRPDERSGITTFDMKTGEVTVTDARGIEVSATRDGRRVAVADSESGAVRIVDTVRWLAGEPGEPGGAAAIEPPVDAAVLDIALDADGSRLAIAYVAASGLASSVVLFRLAGTAWENVATISVPGDEPVSIDWLE